MKLRVKSQRTLFGWDIKRRPGYDLNRRDEYGQPYHDRAVNTFAGDDFREADIFNGKVMRPGGYIDRKTGRKIETDY